MICMHRYRVDLELRMQTEWHTSFKSKWHRTWTVIISNNRTECGMQFKKENKAEHIKTEFKTMPRNIVKMRTNRRDMGHMKYFIFHNTFELWSNIIHIC